MLLIYFKDKIPHYYSIVRYHYRYTYSKVLTTMFDAWMRIWWISVMLETINTAETYCR